MSEPPIQDWVEILDQTWRTDWGRLLGQLMRRYRRADLVEDALADAFAEAARQWSDVGAPANPAGWLRTIAARRVVDALRREATVRSKRELLTREEESNDHCEKHPGGDVDDRLALLFMATHPALAPEVRPALALWPDRLDDVVRAIYLAFTAGYAPLGGERVVRAGAAGEAVRLAELAADLLPGQPVLEALTALLVLQHARRDARTDPAGRPVRLAAQDRRRWRQDEIESGLRRITRLAPTTGLAEEVRLQALIAAFHDTARTAADTDWAAILRTYTRLEQLTGSPIVRLNRAVAAGEVAGPMAGLAVLRAAAEQLPGHHRVALVRAELLRRDGQVEAADRAYTEALAACPVGAVRDHIAGRRATLPH